MTTMVGSGPGADAHVTVTVSDGRLVVAADVEGAEWLATVLGWAHPENMTAAALRLRVADGARVLRSATAQAIRERDEGPT